MTPLSNTDTQPLVLHMDGNGDDGVGFLAIAVGGMMSENLVSSPSAKLSAPYPYFMIFAPKMHI